MQFSSCWQRRSVCSLLVGVLLCLMAGLVYWIRSAPERSPEIASGAATAAHTTSASDASDSGPLESNNFAGEALTIRKDASQDERLNKAEPIAEKILTTEQRLKRHVDFLSDTIGERNLGRYKNLNAAADYVQSQFSNMEYRVETQTFDVQGRECRNLIVEIAGNALADEIVVVGAHYDSAPGTPGANDNASGVAALLVIADELKELKPERTLRMIAFTNEEPPYFQREEQMGSWVYARACRARGDNIVGVISLETIGYFSDDTESQKYPPLLAAFYPSTGNFIGFVANLKSRSFLNKVVDEFRVHSQVPIESATLPEEIQGVGWSDHWSFWQEDYVGLMVTDTAPYRYPHYHLPTDTPDKLDTTRFTQVVEALVPTIEQLLK